jgi:nitrogen fixation NifU-like protein
MMDYNPTVLDHFHNPRNTGDLPGASAVGEAANPACGDRMRLQLRIEGNVVTDARFKTFGCAAAIASSSMLTTLLKGRTLEEARAITNDRVVEALGGLPDPKRRCSVLAEQALRAALDDLARRAASSAGSA